MELEMIQHRFGLRSQGNLIGVHPALVEVTMRALQLSTVDFAITEGLRSMARQQELFKQNKSKTLASRHLTGHAVDVAAMPDGKLSWAWDYYEQIAIAFKQASKELNIPIEWGGDWVSFRDGPHFQLPYATYPKPMEATAGVQA
jgi:peptidoglycan L-alanyl-D-glutamate endopeptidase CwlK